MPRFLVVVDVDSTLIEDEVIDLLAEEAGTASEVAAITAAAMDGKLEFASSLRQRVATLAGLSETAVARVRERVRITEGAEELIAAVHETGGRVAAVSGGFHDVIDLLCAHLELDRWRANCLEVRDGALTGNLSGRVIDAAAKASAVKEWAKVYSIPLRHTIVVGDGANDLTMMDIAGLAVAFDAKPRVRREAHVTVNDRDLSLVLPLLGLRG